MKLYLVGGSVRDLILGVKSNDIDYAVEIDSFDNMHHELINRGYEIFMEKIDFLTIRARKNHKVCDFTICRSDGYYSNNRHPDDVKISDIYTDLSRRDFTVNAIAIDEDGNYIDPYNGIDDCKNKTLRCVGLAYDRLKEDALRILRALRFNITKGFKFDEELDNALYNDDLYPLLLGISVDRKREELYKMLSHNTILTLELLMKYPDNLRKAIFSEGLWLKPTTEKTGK